MQNEHAKELRKILSETSFLTLPGVYDCLSAKIAEEAGFQALFLSGGALAYSVLGRPDFGFLSLAEFGTAIQHIVSSVHAPLIADADNGFGNAIQAANTGAMYEQFGLPGLEAFHRTVEYCRQKDLVIIGDIKRGDIGSTSEAYAVGHLGHVQVGSKSYAGFHEDFATVNPYLGSDGVKPFIKVCKEEKKGIFVLVKTSNPSSGEFQDRIIDGRPLYEWVGEQVAAWGEEHMGDDYSYVGAVVGATYPEMGKVLRKVMPKSYILVPGYGAQGGKGKDLVHFFNEDGLGAIVNSSRGIIAAYKQEKYAEFGTENFADASRAAVKDMVEDISGALAAAK